MSELFATSLSSLKTTMTNSFTEIQSSLEQFAVTDVGDFSDIESLDHGESCRKRPRIATEELPQQSGATARDEPLLAVPQREIDKLISQPSLNVQAETPTDSNSHDIPVLSGIANDLKLEQKKAPAINEQLAKTVQSLMREKLDDEVLTETKIRYLLPENCDSLTRTKVNHLIWD